MRQLESKLLVLCGLSDVLSKPLVTCVAPTRSMLHTCSFKTEPPQPQGALEPNGRILLLNGCPSPVYTATCTTTHHTKVLHLM